jgi:arabinogalactan oligomer / maltooligosaccharide transport system permease protein
MSTQIPVSVAHPTVAVPPTFRSARWQDAISLAIIRLVLIVVCVITIAPIIVIISASFNTSASLFSSTLIPTKPTLLNFAHLFEKTSFLLWMKNSAVVCIGGSLLALALSVSMGYAFSRLRFRGRRYGLLILILIQMLPSSVMIVAIYRLLQAIGQLNHYSGLILVYGGLTIPFNAWLMRGYFNSIPRELEESAYIDGAGLWRAFVSVALPLATPMIAVVFIFNLIGFFNDYILASIVFTGKQHYTVALGMRFFQNPYAGNWTMFAAGALLASLPITIVFYSLQRFLVEGLTQGALKG